MSASPVPQVSDHGQSPLVFLLCFLFSSLPHLPFSFSSLLSPSPSGRLGLSVPLSLPNHQGPSTVGETGPCDDEQDAAQTASEGMLVPALGAGKPRQRCRQPARGLLVCPGSTRHSQSSRSTAVPVLPRLAVCACAWASTPSPLLATDPGHFRRGGLAPSLAGVASTASG